MDRAELIAQAKRLAIEYVENAEVLGLESMFKLADRNERAVIKQTAYHILWQANEDLGCDLG